MSLKTPWVVTHTAVLAFQRRVAPDIPYEEVQHWLRQNAHKGKLLRARTPHGQLQYRLEHPWGSPDAVLVVKQANESLHGVVLTCAWWDDTIPIEADELQLAMELAAARAATPPPKPPPPAPKHKKVVFVERYELPMPPEDLPVPEGQGIDLSFLKEGWSMDHTKLQTPSATRWRSYFLHLEARLQGKPQGVQMRQIYDALRLIKAHLRYLSGLKRHTELPKGLSLTLLLEALKEVLEEELGPERARQALLVAEEKREAKIRALHEEGKSRAP